MADSDTSIEVVSFQVSPSSEVKHAGAMEVQVSTERQVALVGSLMVVELVAL